MDTNRIPKEALQCKPKGPRNMGRPRKRWRDQLHLEEIRLTLQEHDDDGKITGNIIIMYVDNLYKF